jgi:antitoxin (DNA-binding transcriptional repressor) of toxin-antitoxin stability system
VRRLAYGVRRLAAAFVDHARKTTANRQARYDEAMKSATVGELKENLDQFLELVRSGERIEIMDGKERIACLEPTKTIEEIVETQIARGVLRPGTGELPDDFFTRPRPAGGASVLEALIEGRSLRSSSMTQTEVR